MKIADAIALTDEQLRRLYRDWSESFWAAGWMITDSGSVVGFTDWLLSPLGEGRVDPWQDYEREGVEIIRAAIAERSQRGES